MVFRQHFARHDRIRETWKPEHGTIRLTARKTSTAKTPRAKAKKPVSARRKSRAQLRPRTAKFGVGEVVRHRIYPFRGVVFDIDPEFANTEEWWLSIPTELRPSKNQPFYHLLAENSETEYIAYVSEQNLLHDQSGEPLRHPKLSEMFFEDENGRFHPIFIQAH